MSRTCQTTGIEHEYGYVCDTCGHIEGVPRSDDMCLSSPFGIAARNRLAKHIRDNHEPAYQSFDEYFVELQRKTAAGEM